MPLHVLSTCAHHQEVKIALHSLWYHHTETCDWSKITKIQFYKYEQNLENVADISFQSVMAVVQMMAFWVCIPYPGTWFCCDIPWDVTDQINGVCENPKDSHDVRMADVQHVPAAIVTLVPTWVHVAPVQVMYPEIVAFMACLSLGCCPVVMGCCLVRSHTCTCSGWSLVCAA
jgi:hypothetical protein